MQVNEGLPAYLVSALQRRYGTLQGKTVGHPRHGVQGRVGRHAGVALLQAAQAAHRGPAQGAVHRPVRHGRASSPSTVVEESDILVLGAPHKAYGASRSAARTWSTSGARSAGDPAVSASARSGGWAARAVDISLPSPAHRSLLAPGILEPGSVACSITAIARTTTRRWFAATAVGRRSAAPTCPADQPVSRSARHVTGPPLDAPLLRLPSPLARGCICARADRPARLSVIGSCRPASRRRSSSPTSTAGLLGCRDRGRPRSCLASSSGSAAGRSPAHAADVTPSWSSALVLELSAGRCALAVVRSTA